MRYRNWLRRPLFSGPLSCKKTSVSTSENRALFSAHQCSIVSTMQSLVTLDVQTAIDNSSCPGSKRPTGVALPSGPKSWSSAWTGTRLSPPRENSPILTVALASQEISRWFFDCAASSRTRLISSKMAFVSGTFFYLGLLHPDRVISEPVELAANRLFARELFVQV